MEDTSFGRLGNVTYQQSVEEKSSRTQAEHYENHGQPEEKKDEKGEAEEEKEERVQSKPVEEKENTGKSFLKLDDKSPQKSDKAVSTHSILSSEDLQRALTYEAIFHVLLEQKVQAMKRDSEEHKRAKRFKRKTIGKMFFTKRLFSSADSRVESSISEITAGDEIRSYLVHTEPTSPCKMQALLDKNAAVKDYKADGGSDDDEDEIKIASPSTSSHRSRRPTSKMKFVTTASAGQQLPSTTKTTIDDSLASTLSNSSTTNGEQFTKRRHLLVQAQTHTSAEHASADITSSSSGESKLRSRPPTINGQDVGLTDTISFVSDAYGNGTCTRLHTSTLADDSITSIRDSIESLSLASSPYSLSEINPVQQHHEDPLLLDHLKAVKRQRILDAKSISAQCSPILQTRPLLRTVMPKLPSTDFIPDIVIKPSKAIAEELNVMTRTATVTTTTSVSQLTATSDTLMPQQPGHIVGRRHKLIKQYSRVDSKDEGHMDLLQSRDITRQNTSEDSGANLTTISTLLNQSDSSSWHAGYKTNWANVAKEVEHKEYIVDKCFKSKSTSFLGSLSGEPKPPPLMQSSIHLPTTLSLTTPLILTPAALLIDHPCPGLKDRTTALSSPPLIQHLQPESYVVTSDKAASSIIQIYDDNIRPVTTADTKGLHTTQLTFRNGTANGVIVTTSTIISETTKLQRMTSTSTGSSVAPSGCCATTKTSSSREKEKQRVNIKATTKPLFMGQSGSDDEYRRRKRKYKRFHRCSDPALVYPTPESLPNYILTMPTSEVIQYPFNEDYPYDTHLQIESDKMDDLEHIMMGVDSSGSLRRQRHRKHRHHRHKKRRRHKKRKILVQDPETQEVKVIDPDELPQRARWTIIITACLLLMMCLMLVGITLRMAPIIDEMGE